MVVLKCPVRRPRSVRTEFRGNEVASAPGSHATVTGTDGRGESVRQRSTMAMWRLRVERIRQTSRCAQGVAVPEDEERDFAEADKP